MSSTLTAPPPSQTPRFFVQNEPLLNEAVRAIGIRGYWSPFAESVKAYPENAHAQGKAAFESQLNRPFELGQPGTIGEVASEVSPFTQESLGVRYPTTDFNVLFREIAVAAEAWRKAGPQSWCSVSVEVLKRINARSFEIAHAVMHTTGQAFMMAFQAGGPHAQDRGLEAVAYAWEEMHRVPKSVIWEKQQGKELVRMEKAYRITPRGVGLVIGCSTFPTWNGYPGLFASLATGNAVVVKPHPGAVLPLAITVKIAREVLEEAGFDPNVVTMAADVPGEDTSKKLAVRPEVKLIDFTGSPANGAWLEANARQALTFTEKAGVNQVIIDSTQDFKGLVRNLAFSLSLYSGQMCTAPQNLYVPKGGIETAEGHLSFEDVASALREGLGKLLGDPARAVEVLGSIQNERTAKRIEGARSLGSIVADSRPIQHPLFPKARVVTPLLLKVSARDKPKFFGEVFGPISFIVETEGTAQSLALAQEAATQYGGLTLAVYSTNSAVIEHAKDLAAEAGVSLSCNLTGGVFVNQSAAFSDYHGSGANPAANACLTDSAFVAGRFRVAQSRWHI